MGSYRLFFKTLPYVLGMFALALVRDKVLGMHGYFEFAEIGTILTSGAFLIGFMLSGVMADYKESERLPGEIATTLETLEDQLAFCEVKTSAITLADMRARLLKLTDSVHEFLLCKAAANTVFERMNDVLSIAHSLERDGSYHAGRVVSEMHNLRKTVTRVEVIQKTNFMAVGYAFLHLLVGAILVLLLCSKYKSVPSEFLLIGFITLVYVYMVQLIADADGPFDGDTSIDLFPVANYAQRLRARTEAKP